MDRVWPTSSSDRHQSRADRAGDFLLPTRSAAIATLRSAIESQGGPVALTGEAGVGKTWLGSRLREEFPASWRWIDVDLSPANDPHEFYRVIGYALGLSGSEHPGAFRAELSDFLKGAASNGERWVLVVDEAQSVSPTVLEEIRILSNRLGQPDRFAGLVLIGQTLLALRLATRPLSSLSLRLAAQVHLRPIDIEEARTLVDGVLPGVGWDEAKLDRRHRDAAGNPKRLLRFAFDDLGKALPAVSSRPTPPTELAPPSEPDRAAVWDSPVLGPTKPPILVEDGLIEVGWEPLATSPSVVEARSAQAAVAPKAPTDTQTLLAPIPLESEEAVNDHYAALQAWTEWARYQGRNPAADTLSSVECAPGEDQSESQEDEDAARPLGARDQSGFWADGQHGFAPYGQLFSRLRQANNDRP